MNALHNYIVSAIFLRSPRGGATYLAAACNPCALISIHAPHEGERHPREWRFCGGEHFNPRSPRGGATKLPTHHHHKAVFQSTLPTRGSDEKLDRACGLITISIHAPHEGERRCVRPAEHDAENFNPRSPRGGATPPPIMAKSTIRAFQSTLPTRGSDYYYVWYAAYKTISIHAPHEGERHTPLTAEEIAELISIHAPHEGERPAITGGT